MTLATHLHSHWIQACTRGKVLDLERMANGDPWIDLVCKIPKTSCLILAAGNGHEEVCRRLIAHEPQLEERNDEGATPLVVAATEGHVGIVGMLLEAGADPMAVDNDGRSALYHAARNANAELVRLILPKVPDNHIDQRSRYGETALSGACHAIDGSIMQMLLERGANPNQFNESEGERVLRSAVLLDNEVAVALLTKHGARLGHMHNGESYLHTAVRQKCVETVRVLLEAGANPARQNRTRQTAEELAGEVGFKEYDQILVEFQHTKLQARTAGASGVRRVRL